MIYSAPEKNIPAFFANIQTLTDILQVQNVSSLGENRLPKQAATSITVTSVDDDNKRNLAQCFIRQEYEQYSDAGWFGKSRRVRGLAKAGAMRPPSPD
jgi:hypothetical protein